MYFRLYPTKNNCIFKIANNIQSKNINCGANPIYELRDGRSESKLLFRFELPQWLKDRLNVSYKVNLQLWDAGTLFQPAIKLKNVTLSSFNSDFAEGDGYSFDPLHAKPGISNWINALEEVKWEDVSFTPIAEYHLNSINEDLNFDVTSSVTSLNSPSFALSITNHEDDKDVFTKFIHSKYTKTVFQPYLEFFINDEIKDESLTCVGTKQHRIYLINQIGTDFVGEVTCIVQHEGQATQEVNVVKERQGVYYVLITPPLPTDNKEASSINWSIGGVLVKKQFVIVKTPNLLEDTVDMQNVYFYPTTPYSHNIIRQGDVVPFTVISEIRGKAEPIISTYEYRITQADGFEICPWMPVSVYKEKMYFNINTLYFYPEQQYEVWLRNSTNGFTITSNHTYKFKLAQNDKSHMRDLSASPYYSREIFFGK